MQKKLKIDIGSTKPAKACEMRNPELQKWVYTLLERPVGASLFYYHALFGLALLLAIGLSVVQTTDGDDDGVNDN